MSTTDIVPANTKFKFLLHAEDGSFPYLSEYLLQNYFNPEDEIVKNHLILGIAIKDTCIQPVYQDKENKKLKLKRKRKKSEEGDSAGESTGEMTSAKNTIKPTGYTYGTTSLEKQTRLLPGYSTLAVPSFDLLDDSKNAMEKEKANRTKNAQISNKGPKPLPTVPTVTSTKERLSLISPNGMQQISPEMYSEVANKLNCNAILALYDQAHHDEGKKRKATAGERSKAWLEKCIETLEIAENKSPLWAPLSCYHSKWSFADSIKYLSEQQQSYEGIVIVGWHHIQSRNERIELLQKVLNSISPKPRLSILAASNLAQILDAARNNVCTIGSSLPVTWARSYKAMNLRFCSHTGSKEGQSIDSTEGYIDLSNEKYCRDASPILPGCSCLSCRDNKYTRSYVHHLIKANELLAQILLFGHNLHQTLVLFREMSHAASGGANKVEELCTMIESQM
jgi:tRNA-guanine family transglycosylase